MKVIHAPSETPWSAKAACRTCSTIVELEPSDLTMWSDQREGTSYEWGCPTCRSRNYLDGDAVPRDVGWKVKGAR